MTSIGARFGTMNITNAVKKLPDKMSIIPSKIDSVLHRVSSVLSPTVYLRPDLAIIVHDSKQFEKTRWVMLSIGIKLIQREFNLVES